METRGQFGYVLRFGSFEADVETGELRKNGTRTRLQEQPFQVLALLLERPGEIVTRDELREKLWSSDTFVDFDQSLATAVKKIRQVLGDSADTPRFLETLPRRGYRFLAPVERVARNGDLGNRASPGNPAPQTRRSHWFLGLAVAGLGGLIAGAVWLRSPESEELPDVLRVLPLTTDAGEARFPSLSPDGNQVAFQWRGEQQDNFDIYIKLIGTDSTLQLTNHPLNDENPAWSPDGKYLAFLREGPQETEVFVVPALGGRERKVADTFAPALRGSAGLCWSSDGNWLVTSHSPSPTEPPGLFLLSVHTREKRQLTFPPASSLGDFQPAFSPDGRSLVFTHGPRTHFVSDLYLLPLSAEFTPAGKRERLTFENRLAGHPTWMPNGREILFSGTGPTYPDFCLWRMTMSPPGKPQRLAHVGDGGSPTISGDGRRLAYIRSAVETSIWRLNLGVPGGQAASAVKLIASGTQDWSPDFSPDGERIVFMSKRSGWKELWVCRRDGSDAVQLTSMQRDTERDIETASPRWSPDGRQIAFDSNKDTKEGMGDIWTISPEGGAPRRLTSHPANDVTPAWSHDSRWIYFASNRSGEYQIWKMPADGGEAVRITRNGGNRALESPNGEWLYYVKSCRRGNSISKGEDASTEGFGEPACLCRVPASGGEEEEVLDSPGPWNFAVSERGIYSFPRGRNAIEFFRFAGGSVTTVFQPKNPSRLSLALSPDGRSLLFAQRDSRKNDLMLVEHFQ